MRDMKCRADRNDESVLLHTILPKVPMRGSIPSPPTNEEDTSKRGVFFLQKNGAPEIFQTHR